MAMDGARRTNVVVASPPDRVKHLILAHVHASIMLCSCSVLFMSSVSGPRAQRRTEKGGHSVQLGARVEDPRRSHEEHVARKPAHASRPAEVNMLMSVKHKTRRPQTRQTLRRTLRRTRTPPSAAAARQRGCPSPHRLRRRRRGPQHRAKTSIRRRSSTRSGGRAAAKKRRSPRPPRQRAAGVGGECRSRRGRRGFVYVWALSAPRRRGAPRPSPQATQSAAVRARGRGKCRRRAP